MAVDVSMPVLVVDDYKTMIRIIRNLLETAWASRMSTMQPTDPKLLKR